jgi:hypothetical protein
MKYIMKVRIPNETRNEKIRDPQFGMKMKDILTEVKAEAVYFTTISGTRYATRWLTWMMPLRYQQLPNHFLYSSMRKLSSFQL